MSDPLAAAVLCATFAIVAVAAAGCARVFRTRLRRAERALEELRRREEERRVYCGAYGHHVDEACRCTRCLADQHDDRELASRRIEVGSELVNPRADPGALHLDSNFQPDPDYGRTQTIYRVERTHRCARCGRVIDTTEREAVLDEP